MIIYPSNSCVKLLRLVGVSRWPHILRVLEICISEAGNLRSNIGCAMYFLSLPVKVRLKE